MGKTHLIVKRVDNDLEIVKCELADISDIDDIYNHFNYVYSRMEDKSYLFIGKKEDVLSCFKSGAACVVRNNLNQIIGCLTIWYPKTSSENLGYDIGFTSEQLLKVAHIETVTVSSEYRGNGLQSFMMDFAEQQIDSYYEYLMATVSPSNLASKKTFLSKGYQIVARKEKYGCLLRDILLKNRLDSSK